MANVRVPTQKGREITEAVTVLVGGKSFDGWESVNITKNVDSISNAFKIRLFDKFEGLRQNWPFRPGVSVKINIGKSERVLTGRIEKINVDYTDERRGYAISGRSRPGDLVDCTHEGPNEYKNIKLDDLAVELVKPFGLRVFLSVTPGIIEKFAVKSNETVFEALDRAARLQGFFFISTRGGNIRLTRAARARSFSSLEQSVNILEATAEYDDSQRHNKYTVKGQSAGTDDFFGINVAHPKGSANDVGVGRHRPLTLIAEASIDSDKAKTRAEWEASVRLARAIKVTALVQGWTQDDGSLWGINQVTHFKSTFLGLNRDLLITGVEHVDGADEGKTTSLSLTDPQAYAPNPNINSKESDDIFKNLGSLF